MVQRTGVSKPEEKDNGYVGLAEDWPLQGFEVCNLEIILFTSVLFSSF